MIGEERKKSESLKGRKIKREKRQKGNTKRLISIARVMSEQMKDAPVNVPRCVFLKHFLFQQINAIKML